MLLQSSDARTVSWHLKDMVMRRDSQQIFCRAHVNLTLGNAALEIYSISSEPARCQKKGKTRSILSHHYSLGGEGQSHLAPSHLWRLWNSI